MSAGSITDKLGGLRISHQIERDAERTLKAEGASPAIPIVDERYGAGTPGNVPITTNVYGIRLNPMPVYRYDVKIIAVLKKGDGTDIQVDLTKKVKGDAITVDYRERCRDVFLYFQNNSHGLLKNVRSAYYDLQSILYSMDKLDIAQGQGVTFDIPVEKLGQTFVGFSACKLEVRAVTKDFELTLGGLSHISRDLTQSEHSQAQFLDMATSQDVFYSKNFVNFSANTAFLIDHQAAGFRDTDIAAFPENSSYLAIGAQKNVRFVEGPRKTGSAALIVQAKKTPFHNVEPLLNKVRRIARDPCDPREFKKINSILTGLAVETKHLGRFQRLNILGMNQQGAKDTQITINGGTKISVADYFLSKYNITLKEPRYPLVKTRGRNNEVNYIPVEMCTVVDNQRLKTNQQTSRQVQDMIKKCAVPPAILREQTGLIVKSLNLGANNEYLKNAQIGVMGEPLQLSARSIPPPDLVYSRNSVVRVRTDTFGWQGREFLIPKECKKWAAIAFLTSRERLTERDMKELLDRFTRECSNRGMRLGEVQYVKILSADARRMTDEIQQLASNGFDFVLVVHPDMADDIHAHLKYCEGRFSVLTQAIRHMTFMNILQKNQNLTLQNIVAKTNIKFGGLNYSLSLDSPGAKDVLGTSSLYIGFGTNHPGGGLGMDIDEVGSGDGSSTFSKSDRVPPPSIVGYAANIGREHEFEIIGDFIFQQPLREEKIDVIRTIVERCVQSYRKYRRSDPRRIYLYRNGCSEGAFQLVLKYEVPLVKLALQKLNCNAKLIVIVPNKLQSIRFFNKDIDARAKPTEQNVKPGLVVDYCIVHPAYPEFFLNSHRALQGTARTPKYTVLVNEDKIELEVLERITYQLCYGHQIVNLSTSLPSPVYIANRYSERGRKLYQRHIQSDPRNAKLSYEELTNALSYYGNEVLDYRRINA